MPGLFDLGELSSAFGVAAPLAGFGFVWLAYFLTAIDRLRASSPNKDDGQVGLKLVLFGFMLSGIVLAAGGVQSLLHLIFIGFTNGGEAIRQILPAVIVGGLVILVVSKLLLPRTNAAKARQPERLFLGVLSVGYGLMFVFAIYALVFGLFNKAEWKQATAGNVAQAMVFGALAIFAITRLGRVSGWTTPPPPPAPIPPAQQGHPPQGGGYPPQGGGYPPQGGYGPQGGGGGYPPQGGYGPQGGGGGYPPQGGGGGYPPQGGGGYGPQGGGGGYGPQGGGGGYGPR
ncbi:MAG: hypothetical protein AB7O24_16855 [Kofleriaceae bacterium]